MKKFSKTQIDEWRDEFVKSGYSQLESNLDNRSIDFFVLPINLFKDIPNGLFRMTGEVNEGYLIGVSDEVPTLLKSYFALSEHDEFMVYGLKDSDRTLHSEQNIIRVLNKQNSNLQAEYVSRKLKLYSHILDNSRTDLDSWGFSLEDYQGFERARDFLQNLKY